MYPPPYTNQNTAVSQIHSHIGTEPDPKATEPWQLIALFIGIRFPFFWIAAAVSPAHDATAKQFRRWNQCIILVPLAVIGMFVAFH